MADLIFAAFFLAFLAVVMLAFSFFLWFVLEQKVDTIFSLVFTALLALAFFLMVSLIIAS